MVSLEERHERADMIQAFKIIHGFSDVNTAAWFRKINYNRVTRMANDLLNVEIQNSRTSISISILKVKQSTTVNIFK